MDNFLMMTFTAMSGIGAVAAVFAAVRIYFRQKKIALFERRMQILNDFEAFVFNILPTWTWDGSVKLVAKYSEQEVTALFNKEFAELQKDILQTAEICNTLRGDIEHAKRRGTCHNKTESELEAEKIAYEDELGNRFKEKRGIACKEWLTL